ncbi:MAG: DUF429 domain-containing protein [archaeon]
MTTFLGIDLSWSMDPNPNSSGACLLNEKGKVLEMKHVGKDEEIIKLAHEHEADYIGIDAPLKIPNKEGARPVERELARRGRPAYPANQKFFNKHYGGIRGERLVEKFKENNYPFIERTEDEEKGVIEVYPNPTIKALLGEIPSYKNVKKEQVKKGISKIWEKLKDTQLPVKIDLESFKDPFIDKELEGLLSKELKRKGDLLDSFFCAYVLLLDYKDISSVELIGNKQEGYILTLIENNDRLTDFMK